MAGTHAVPTHVDPVHAHAVHATPLTHRLRTSSPPIPYAASTRVFKHAVLIPPRAVPVHSQGVRATTIARCPSPQASIPWFTPTPIDKRSSLQNQISILQRDLQACNELYLAEFARRQKSETNCHLARHEIQSLKGRINAKQRQQGRKSNRFQVDSNFLMSDAGLAQFNEANRRKADKERVEQERRDQRTATERQAQDRRAELSGNTSVRFTWSGCKRKADYQDIAYLLGLPVDATIAALKDSILQKVKDSPRFREDPRFLALYQTSASSRQPAPQNQGSDNLAGPSSPSHGSSQTIESELRDPSLGETAGTSIRVSESVNPDLQNATSPVHSAFCPGSHEMRDGGTTSAFSTHHRPDENVRPPAMWPPSSSPSTGIRTAPGFVRQGIPLSSVGNSPCNTYPHNPPFSYQPTYPYPPPRM
ncbi:hypothetical protein PLICRDRAFT_180571 [Plicaturopsis crispa FD-325 SS-3]|uniref:Uncharacterized protein n=1 Tax=Plicaturopsis crispa FD-325 SS-3 TaxID=944288 RepID=A0A0C9SVX5_PLICR|nr:hypothetical protein PLICRDRAFT_180571 [Plicaturopsis crispa FD-325 SS-3]